MDVVQTYTFIDPQIAAPMVAGASEGWRSDEAAKQKWFGGTPGHWQLLERHMDVRVGEVND